MKRLKRILADAYLGIIFLLMYAPIATLMVLSFNSSKSRAKWGGFTLDWYQKLLDSPEIMEALMNTLSIAFFSALIATVIGTLACIAINRMHKSTKGLFLALNNIPLLNGDIVTGISMMLVFIAFGITFGYGSILIAHTTFNIPYVVLSVLPRLRQTNRSTYEAAMDLGAAPVQAFVKVVLPELFPGILSGFLMAFTMSLDDFIITHFTKGAGINTLSTLIYSEVRRGIQPTMYALSTIMFIAALVLLALAGRPKRKKEAV